MPGLQLVQLSAHLSVSPPIYNCAPDLEESLELPYRIWQKCTADMGYFASHKQYDLDVWLPSQQEYMETMSATNASDYQARRMKIRFVDKDGQKKFCHTVNDTGSAMGRGLNSEPSRSKASPGAGPCAFSIRR